jgi:hypothetical protein
MLEQIDTNVLDTIFLAMAAVGGTFAGFMSHKSNKKVTEGKVQLDGISLAIGKLEGGQRSAESSRRTMQGSIEGVIEKIGGVKQQVEHVERSLGNFGERLGTVEKTCIVMHGGGPHRGPALPALPEPQR